MFKMQKKHTHTKHFASYLSKHISSFLRDVIDFGDVDIEAALFKITDGTRKAGRCTQITVIIGNDKGSQV